MTRNVNSKFALIFLAVLILIAVSVFGLHRVQSQRTAGLFLTKAREQAQSENYGAAIRSYRSHIRLDPGSLDGNRELGDLLAKIGDSAGAARQYERFLLIDPADTEVRRSAAKASLDSRRFSDAKDHLARLDNVQEDAELLRWLALCEAGQGNFKPAIEHLEKVIDLAPDKLDGYVALASVLRETSDAARATSVMKDMTTRNSDSAEAHFIHSGYQLGLFREAMRGGQREDAERIGDHALRLARKAVSIEPRTFNYLMHLAQCEVFQGNLDQALLHARAASDLDPLNPAGHLLVSELWARSGDTDKAIDYLRTRLDDVDEDQRGGILVALADQHLNRRQVEEASEIVERLARFPALRDSEQFLRARIDLFESNWDAAIERLEAVALRAVGQPDEQRRIQFLLGVAFRGNSQLGLAAGSFRRAIAIDPTWVQPKLALVEVLELTGQREASLELLREIVRRSDAPDSAWLALARQTINQTLGVRRDQRDWTEAERILAEATRRLPDEAQLTVLRAAILKDRGDSEAAVDLLDENQADTPEKRRLFLINKANLAIAAEDWDQASDLLAAAEKEFPVDVNVMLARVQLSALRDPSQAATTIRTAVAASSVLAEEDRIRLLASIGRFAAGLGEAMLAKETLDLAIQMQDDSVGLWTTAASLAMAAKDLPWLQETAGKLKTLPGGTGAWNMASAQLLWARSKIEDRKLTDKERDELLGHVAAAQALLPTSPLPALLQADVLIEDGRPTEALDALRQVIDFGVRAPAVIQATVSLLFEAGEYEEANEVMQLLADEDVTKTEGMGRMASRLLAGENDPVSAMKMARQAAKDSDDARDHLWHAQLTASLLSAVSKDQVVSLANEAAGAFARATTLSPENDAYWIARLSFLGRVSRPKEADEVFERFRESKAWSPFASAQGLVAVGRQEEAIQQFQAALEDDKLDTADQVEERRWQIAITYFLQQRRLDLAKTRLEQFASRGNRSEQATLWLRRRQAELVLATGSDADKIDSLAQIRENLKRSPDDQSIEDLRLLALLLQSKAGGSDDTDALNAWANVAKLPGATASDHFQLASLAYRRDDWGNASEQVRKAISKSSATASERQYITTYVAWMLGRDETSEAKVWIDRLAKVDPDSGIAQAMKARWNAKLGRHDEAVITLESVSKLAAEPQQLTKLKMDAAREAQLLSQLVTDEASQPYLALEEKLVQEAIEKDPRQRLAWVALLVRRGRMQEAMDQLDAAPIVEGELPGVIALVDAAVLTGELDPDQLNWFESLVAKLEEQFGDSNAILGAAATVQKGLGNFTESEALYRRMLVADPNSVLALNNLAVQLAEEDDRLSEAVTLVDNAIEVAGRLPALLDTRATIAIAQGDHELALELLEQAIATSRGTSAMFLFHRAVALSHAGRHEEAKQVLESLSDARLNSLQLGPREIGWLESI
ncbi:MAG: tetratricopeptide repeat protein [Planctomycetota bacterium]